VFVSYKLTRARILQNSVQTNAPLSRDRKANEFGGTVKVEVVVDQDGKVKEAKVIGGHPILVGSILETLKEWKYEPAKSEMSATLTFDFHP
jgi:TonB family protein